MSITTSDQRSTGPQDSKGWDGKLRIGKRATLRNPETLSDPDYSDEDAPPVEQIAADEGSANRTTRLHILMCSFTDLLEEYDAKSNVRPY